MDERPDELDAVSLGLKRGPRGLAALVVIVSLGLVAAVVASRDEVAAAPAPTPAPVETELLAPLPFKPTPKKRSRTARGTPPRVVTSAPSAPAATPEPAEAPTRVAVEEPVAPSEAEPGLEPVATSDTLPPPPPAPEPEIAAEEERAGNGEAIARDIAAAKRAAVRECFERELKQSPKLSGTVVVELDLGAPNAVNDVRVADDLERPAFTQCVQATMRDVRFSTALDEDISVRVPYALRPEKK